MRSYYIVIFFIVTVSCNKFLDKKPSSKLNIPSSLQDLQLLLDNYTVFNSQYPYALETLADNYYLSSEEWSAMDESQRTMYIWGKTDKTSEIWNPLYQTIYNANVVLDNIENIKYAPSEENSRNNIEGSALFFRGYNYYLLSQLFAIPYSDVSAKTSPGIPLRLSSSFDEVSTRSSLEETYTQLISDLHKASNLLPNKTLIKTRPNKAAAFGVLAKVFLSMQVYDSAGYYANKCIIESNELIDYNSLSSSSPSPFTRFNEEVIFQLVSANSYPLMPGVSKIDSTLIDLYLEGDLRKDVFFLVNPDGTFTFKGDYDGSNQGSVFGGVVVDEMYLIRAESSARDSNKVAAINDLNILLEKRWKKDLFTPTTATSSGEALSIILTERRKELIFRGTRWSDLRRLNFESNYAKTLTRNINNQFQELKPNSARYVLQIPLTVITKSGMTQNE